jgi:hypothetical protein
VSSYNPGRFRCLGSRPFATPAHPCCDAQQTGVKLRADCRTMARQAMLALTANSRATLEDAARTRVRVSQCREHARLPQHRATTHNVCAWDTRACPSTHQAQCYGACNPCARSARKWVPGTRAGPSTHRSQCEPRAIPHQPVRILLFQISHPFCRARVSGSYKYQVPQENTSKGMKHLAIFRKLTLISGLYLGWCRK